jgi:alkylation response protein AidB-like acyl-CoA dehydrogenase
VLQRRADRRYGRRAVHIDLTPEQRALQRELREYFEALMTPERRSELKGGEAGGEAYRALVRRLGTDGKLGTGWPKEYGGQGRTPLEQYLFYDEANRAGVPLPLVTLNTVGPTLMLYGSDNSGRDLNGVACTSQDRRASERPSVIKSRALKARR